MKRYIYRCSLKRVLCGISVGVWPNEEEDDDEAAFTKMEAALSLIRTYAPVRFACLERDVQSILVMDTSWSRGVWYERLRMCQLHAAFVLSQETSAALVASVLVHEAMHARLLRWGFGYKEYHRARIERICCKAQRAFARRLPDGAEIVEEAERGILQTRNCALWSDQTLCQAHLQVLRDMGWPEWALRALVRLGAWLRSRRGNPA